VVHIDNFFFMLAIWRPLAHHSIHLRWTAMICFFRKEWFKIQSISEFEGLVIFRHHIFIGIVLIAVQWNLKNWRQLFEPNKFLGILLAMCFCFILVVSIKFFCSNILTDTIFNGLISVDTEWDGVENILFCRFIINVITFNYVFTFSFKQLFICSLNLCAFHLLF